MCRVIAYIGEPLSLDVLLYESDSSLVKQAYDPKLFSFMNLAGCGISVWNNKFSQPELPLIYKETKLPMFDRNLRQISRKIKGDCIIGHVRGTDYFSGGDASVSQEDVHPFRHRDYRIVMAHNGGLNRFNEMKYDLLEYINPEAAKCIEGTTDSEWIYAVLVSRLENPAGNISATQLADAVEETLRILREVRTKRKINLSSPVNLFASNGECLVVTRFTFDFGCYEGIISPMNLMYNSLWFTAGSNYGLHNGDWRFDKGMENIDSALIASEPLTDDTSTWIEVPEYTLLTISRDEKSFKITSKDIDI